MVLPRFLLPGILVAVVVAPGLLANEPGDSLVLVWARLGQGSLGRQGSGVVVGPGLVATNAHVVQGVHHLIVVRDRISWPVTQVRIDFARDLCLLTVPGLPLPTVAFSPDPTTVGQEVQAVGFPGGRGPLASQGRLLGVWHYGDANLLQSDAPTHPGSSGGGLFDREGRLIGLTTFTFSDNSRLNFSLPLQWVRDLAQTNPESLVAGDPHPESLVSSDFLSKLIEDGRNWPAWEQAARAWAGSNPDDPDAWMALGLALDHQARLEAERGASGLEGLLSEAVLAFEKSLSIRRISLRPQAVGWNALGVTLDSLNEFEKAQRAFRQALRLDASYGRAWANLGASLLNGRQFKAAAEALGKGLAFDPDDSTAWTRYAYALNESGAFESAVDAYVIALRYRPFSDSLWLELGTLRLKLKQRAAAEAVLARLQGMDSPLAAKLEALLRKAAAPSNPKPRRKPLRRTRTAGETQNGGSS